jgi:hypothetical protein
LDVAAVVAAHWESEQRSYVPNLSRACSSFMHSQPEGQAGYVVGVAFEQ